MISEETLKYINDTIRNTGVSFFGYSDLRNTLTGTGWLESLATGITIGVNLNQFIMNQIKDKPTFSYFHHYRTVNAMLDKASLEISMSLEKLGYSAVPVPASQTVKSNEEAYNIHGEKYTQYSSIFPHKTAAVKAGLGWIGRNALFISNDFGPAVRLATVLTDSPLPVYKGEIPDIGKCGDCYECVKACPAMAITGEIWKPGEARDVLLDAKACSDYMNSEFKGIGRGSVCGLCIVSCKYFNRKYQDDIQS